MMFALMRCEIFSFIYSDFSVIFPHAIFRVRQSSYFQCFNSILSCPSTKCNLGLLIFIDVEFSVHAIFYIEQLCFIQPFH